MKKTNARPITVVSEVQCQEDSQEEDKEHSVDLPKLDSRQPPPKTISPIKNSEECSSRNIPSESEVVKTKPSSNVVSIDLNKMRVKGIHTLDRDADGYILGSESEDTPIQSDDRSR